MKIAIFGGTGMTGQCAVRHAIEKGLDVTLLIRSESTLPSDFKGKVKMVQGDVMNLEDVKKTVAGVDAVAVVLGTRNNLGPTTLLSKGTENVITAMKEAGLKKISVCVSAFQFRKPEDIPAIFKDHSIDHQRQLDLVKASGLEYRAVLPPHISSEPKSKFIVTHDKSPGRVISKHDLGAFMVDCLDQEEHNGKIIGLATTENTPVLKAYRIFHAIRSIPVFLWIYVKHRFGIGRPQIKNE